MKELGYVITFIGGIIAFINAKIFISRSGKIQAWYYYRSELESARMFLIVGIALLIIGVAILLTTHLKNSK